MSPFNPILMSKRSLGGGGNLPCFRCMLPLCHMKVDSTSIPSLGVEGVKLTGCFFFFFIFFIFFFIIIQISFRRFSIANLQGSVRWNCLILWFWVFFPNIVAFLSMDDISTYVCALSLPKMTVSRTIDFRLPLFQANKIATNGTKMEPWSR